MRYLKLIVLMTFSIAAQASVDQPTDAEMRNWQNFLRSLTVPATTEVCTAIPKFKDEYAAAAELWLKANEQEIAQGREFAKAGLPKEKNFDQYFAAMAADFRKQLLTMPDEFKIKRCTDSFEIFRKVAK